MKPSELFIGVVDLFAIVLPGAILAFLVNQSLTRLEPWVGHALLPTLDGPALWFAFFLESYLLGHFVFGLSSLLDDLYDGIRRSGTSTALYDVVTSIRAKHLLAAKEAVAKHGVDAWPGPKPVRGWLRAIAWLTEGSWRLEMPRSEHVMNTFKFALAMLQLRSPVALLAVKRFEADSKFFRSVVVLLVIVLLALAVHLAWHVWHAATHAGEPPTWLIELSFALVVWALLRMSFARYCEQRQKTVDLAYQLLVVSTALEAAGSGEIETATIDVPE